MRNSKELRERVSVLTKKNYMFVKTKIIYICKMFVRSARSAAGHVRAFSQKGAATPPASQSSSTVNANVPGLSSKIVLPKSQPLGPGAATDGIYKVPEYYCYNRTSYYEAEVELAQFRCPQPSALKK